MFGATHRQDGSVTQEPALLSPTGLAQLREGLLSAGYTAAGILARLGPQAAAAAGRNDSTRRTRPASILLDL
jgi:hypothetical protein